MFNIVIIGAGPTGCYLGQLLQSYGFNPLILEEHPEVGRPIACAGIVGSDVFRDAELTISKNSIINKIDGAEVSYKDSSFSVRRPEVAYIIERDKFDKDLSRDLNIKFNTRFLSADNNGSGYIVKTNQGDFKADYVIGADGPFSAVRKVFGFKSKMHIYSGLQYRIKNGFHKKDRVEVDFIKPFSLFSWIIPEGNGVIRVGTIGRETHKELQNFIENKNIQGEIIEKIAGPIPIGMCQMVKDNVALLGDAACQVKPITGGGIYYGMRAAEMLAQAIKENNLVQYELNWKKRYAREIRLCIFLRQLSENLNEKTLNSMFVFMKDNAQVIEKAGDFENHSSALMSLLSNPQTYLTGLQVGVNVIMKPRLLKQILFM